MEETLQKLLDEITKCSEEHYKIHDELRTMEITLNSIKTVLRVGGTYKSQVHNIQAILGHK